MFSIHMDNSAAIPIKPRRSRLISPLDATIEIRASLLVRPCFLKVSAMKRLPRISITMGLDRAWKACDESATPKTTIETKTIRLAKGSETGWSVNMLLVKTKAARAALPACGRLWGVGRRRKIRVNAVCPGVTLTPLVMLDSTEEMREAVRNTTPLRDIVKPDDIANAVIFLASERARMITGSTIDVDGGMSLSHGQNWETYVRTRKEPLRVKA